MPPMTTGCVKCGIGNEIMARMRNTHKKFCVTPLPAGLEKNEIAAIIATWTTPNALR